jgi:hypothetical protein
MNEQQLAAVKQALEALKECSGLAPFEPPPKAVNAITALQSIISQDALDKKAENARELGLDYEPAVQEGRDWSLLEATQESLREHMAEIKRLKAEQPVPVKTYHDGKPWPVAPKPWVGLTKEDKEFIELTGGKSDVLLAELVESKLKGKNHDQ